MNYVFKIVSHYVHLELRLAFVVGRHYVAYRLLSVLRLAASRIHFSVLSNMNQLNLTVPGLRPYA